MGCLNSTGQFNHWFGNIHLSGPCNRSCYFCIGQHMMALDKQNTLDTFPLPGLDKFIEELLARNIKEVNLTGTNTDPLLYRHTLRLWGELSTHIPDLVFGIRTNGVRALGNSAWHLFDKISLSIPSLDPDIYRTMMGGEVPDLQRILYNTGHARVKINVVLSPYNTGEHLSRYLLQLADMGIQKINLREPYGQAHIGDPLAALKLTPSPELSRYGMPTYEIGKDTQVTYWDVHYVEVESVNLYANGRVSVDYPITRGHDDSGTVIDQSHWTTGRHVEQWQK